MTPAAPPPAASPRLEHLLTLPRVPEPDLPAVLQAAHWPPVPGAALALQQAWLPKPEAAFQTGTTWLAASSHALLFFAELSGSGARTSAVADHELLCDRGDVFEIFLQSFGGEAYFEFQIAPNGRLLQLHYPWIGASRHEGIERYIRRDRLIEFALHFSPETARWRVAARVPVAPLLPSHPRTSGAEWRLACCRYDYRADGKFCLSSTAALTRPDFHRIGEWARVSVPGGFLRTA